MFQYRKQSRAIRRSDLTRNRIELIRPILIECIADDYDLSQRQRNQSQLERISLRKNSKFLLKFITSFDYKDEEKDYDDDDDDDDDDEAKTLFYALLEPITNESRQKNRFDSLVQDRINDRQHLIDDCQLYQGDSIVPGSGSIASTICSERSNPKESRIVLHSAIIIFDNNVWIISDNLRNQSSRDFSQRSTLSSQSTRMIDERKTIRKSSPKKARRKKLERKIRIDSDPNQSYRYHQNDDDNNLMFLNNRQQIFHQLDEYFLYQFFRNHSSTMMIGKKSKKSSSKTTEASLNILERSDDDSSRLIDFKPPSIRIENMNFIDRDNFGSRYDDDDSGGGGGEDGKKSMIRFRFKRDDVDVNEKRTKKNKKVYNIETIIFVDRFLIDRFNGERKQLERLILTIMNEVQLIYNFDSLRTRIRILIKKIIYLDSSFSQDVPDTANGDIDLYLDNFCAWQKRLWRKANPNYRWDHALMLTGLDLYKQIGYEKNKKVLGLAWVNGMCRPSYSCTLNEAKNFESSFVIAHELAHSLGMLHDGLDNNCDPDKFIMSEKTGPGKINWSPCSNLYLENFLKKTDLKCLERTSDESFFLYTSQLDSNGENYPHELRLPGELYTLNQQCQLALGDQYRAYITQRSPFNDICKELWCSHGNWASPAHPALEGSPCGPRKSCSQGLCVPMDSNDSYRRKPFLYYSNLNPNRRKKTRYPSPNMEFQNNQIDVEGDDVYTNNDGEDDDNNHRRLHKNNSTNNRQTSSFMKKIQNFLRNAIKSIIGLFSG
ncbi:A disintegrin and metalloproteinase with thrombospondin motifs 2 [Sarcoptes scabiei]|uniref:A disintegrin and metalloproteinase with thrombospondin motifs 2 n=1 Tax=Sarcoptes scabiei TaxID=52283 RepID=A0A834VDF0_SARSC|nr:A disintegrin and metalloproteinase with thrombospondin motifs 2 [Sarcoptes scabiei]